MDLISLVEELERQKENSLDLIVESDDLCAIPDEEEGIRLGVPDKGQWYLTEWAHLQLAEKLGFQRNTMTGCDRQEK